MTLSRAVLLLVVLASSCAFAAGQKQQPTSPENSWSTPLESLHLVPWFTGMKHVNQDPNAAPKLRTRDERVPLSPSGLRGTSCLKLRTYKVRGQETLSDGESALVSYSTCQWATNYQVRSAVQTIQRLH